MLEQIRKAFGRKIDVLDGDRLAVRRPQSPQQMDPASGWDAEHLGHQGIGVERLGCQDLGAGSAVRFVHDPREAPDAESQSRLGHERTSAGAPVDVALVHEGLQACRAVIRLTW